jgi:hypothetical protein
MLENFKDLERGIKEAQGKDEKDMFIDLLKDDIKEADGKVDAETQKFIDKLKEMYLGAKKKATPKVEKKPTPKTTKKPRAKLTPEQRAKNKEKIKTATGKTIEECKEILAKYEALRGKTVKKDEETAKKEKQRVQKLKDEDKIIDGTNVKTADATTETTAKEIPKKIKQEVDAIEKEAEQEAKKEVNPKGKTKAEVKKEVEEVKIEKIEEKVKDMTKDLAEKSNELIDAMTNTITELSPSKEEAIKFLMDIRNHIDVLLKSNKFEFGGAVQSYDIAWAGGGRPMPMFEKGGNIESFKKIMDSTNDYHRDRIRQQLKSELLSSGEKDEIREMKEKQLEYLEKNYSKGGKFADGGEVHFLPIKNETTNEEIEGSIKYNEFQNHYDANIDGESTYFKDLGDAYDFMRGAGFKERSFSVFMPSNPREFSKGGEVNKRFLENQTSSYRDRILKSIANHYGTTTSAIKEELYDKDAEMIYEYIGNDRGLRMKVYEDMQNYSKGGKFADGGMVETKRDFLEIYNRVVEENEAIPNDYVNVLDVINAELQDRGYEEFSDDADEIRNMVIDRYEKKELSKKGLRFSKGGKFADGGEIEKPYQVYNNDTNSVEGYFDNEFEAEAKAREFENASVYDLRMMAKGGKFDDGGMVNSNGEHYTYFEYQIVKEYPVVRYDVKIGINDTQDFLGELVAEYDGIELDEIKEIFGNEIAQRVANGYGRDYVDGDYRSKVIFVNDGLYKKGGEILNAIAEDWGRNSDVYYAVQDSYVAYDSDEKAKEVLENYDVLEDYEHIFKKGGKLPKKTKLGRSRDWHKRSKESHELAYQKKIKSKGKSEKKHDSKSEKKYEIDDTILVKPKHASRGDIKDLYDEIKENMYEYKTFKAPNNEADYISITPDNFSERNRITEYLDDESWDYEEYKKGGKLPRKKGLGWKRDRERLSKEPHEQAYKPKRKGSYSSFEMGGEVKEEYKEFFKRYEENEDRNAHLDNAMMLVSEFGTADELKRLIEIQQMHHKQGYLTLEQSLDLYEIQKPYYRKMFAKGGKTNWVQKVVDSPNFREGAFRRKAEARGMSTDAFMNQVLHSPNLYDERTRKQAQFMKNAFND